MVRQYVRLSISWPQSDRKKKKLFCLFLTALKHFHKNRNILAVSFIGYCNQTATTYVPSLAALL